MVTEKSCNLSEQRIAGGLLVILSGCMIDRLHDRLF